MKAVLGKKGWGRSLSLKIVARAAAFVLPIAPGRFYDFPPLLTKKATIPQFLLLKTTAQDAVSAT